MSALLAVGITCHANNEVVDDLSTAMDDLHGEGRTPKTESEDDEFDSSSVDEHVKTAVDRTVWMLSPDHGRGWWA